MGVLVENAKRDFDGHVLSAGWYPNASLVKCGLEFYNIVEDNRVLAVIPECNIKGIYEGESESECQKKRVVRNLRWVH